MRSGVTCVSPTRAHATADRPATPDQSTATIPIAANARPSRGTRTHISHRDGRMNCKSPFGRTNQKPCGAAIHSATRPSSRPVRVWCEQLQHHFVRSPRAHVAASGRPPPGPRREVARRELEQTRLNSLVANPLWRDHSDVGVCPSVRRLAQRGRDTGLIGGRAHACPLGLQSTCLQTWLAPDLPKLER